MREKLVAILPEIRWINNDELREYVIDTYLEVIQIAKLEVEDMGRMAFVGRGYTTNFSYVEYVRDITGMCKSVLEKVHISYAEQIGYSLNGLTCSLEHDTLIAGALLHDVGKLMEYELTSDGRTVESKTGKYMRHPFSGAAVAYKNSIPATVIHIIAMHSREGNGRFRSPEAIALIDIINFKMTKARLNINLTSSVVM